MRKSVIVSWETCRIRLGKVYQFIEIVEIRGLGEPTTWIQMVLMAVRWVQIL